MQFFSSLLSPTLFLQKEEIERFGGGERIRTADLPRARRTLYQLSYTPKTARIRARFIFINKAVLGKTYATQDKIFNLGGPKPT